MHLRADDRLSLGNSWIEREAHERDSSMAGEAARKETFDASLAGAYSAKGHAWVFSLARSLQLFPIGGGKR